MSDSIMIATPHGGDVSPYWLDSFLSLVKPWDAETGAEAWGRGYTVRLEVAVARNQLVEMFLKSAHTHLLFWDDDVLAPPDALMQLSEVGAPIVSGFYVTRSTPPKPVAYRAHPKKPHIYQPVRPTEEKLYRVDGIGFGFVLIERSVFEKIPAPWFQFICGADGAHRSEDFVFCELARAAGIPILLHGGVQCGHVGRYVFDDGDLPRLRKKSSTS
jgi:hypothetical protein